VFQCVTVSPVDCLQARESVCVAHVTCIFAHVYVSTCIYHLHVLEVHDVLAMASARRRSSAGFSGGV